MLPPVPEIDGFTPEGAGLNRRIYVSGRNLDKVGTVYVSGISIDALSVRVDYDDPKWKPQLGGGWKLDPRTMELNEDEMIPQGGTVRNPLAPNTSSHKQEGITYNPEYYIEVPCKPFVLENGTGLYFNTPNNLAKSGYVKLKSREGEEVESSNQLFLSRIEKISPELAFLDDQKVLVKGVNLNFPGLDLRFRGSWNPPSKDQFIAEDFRFVHPSGTVKFHGASYMDTSWGATGAYIYPNREIQCESVYLVSGKKATETKATGPHETFFTNSYGMVVDKSAQRFIPQPEISGKIRKLVPGANKTYSDGGKYGLVGLPFAAGEQFYMTGVNCFNVSRNLIATYARQAFTASSNNFKGYWDEAVVSKIITKNLSGFHTNVSDKYLIPTKDDPIKSYYGPVTGSLSGHLTGDKTIYGKSWGTYDTGVVILSGTFGEGLTQPGGMIGTIMAGNEVDLIMTLCSTCDTNCNLDGLADLDIGDDGKNYVKVDAPKGGSVDKFTIDCGDKETVPDAEFATNAQDRINKYLLDDICP
jgi:hypothetical protein